jgi:hypothetical protein
MLTPENESDYLAGKGRNDLRSLALMAWRSSMPIRAIYAHLSCVSLANSAAWFAKLFGRPPDARPMAGLVEWHLGHAAGLQLFEDPTNSGHGTLTLLVDGLWDEHERLSAAHLNPGDAEEADTVSLIRLRDPDGNLVVFAEPTSS